MQPPSTWPKELADDLRGQWAKVRPGPGDLRQGAVGGLPLAAAAVPDGMASATLVGVNPIFGLYASFIGPIIGGLTSSSRLMVVGATSAASLATFSALKDVDPADRPAALGLVTLLAALFMIAAGYAGLGRFVSFVSQSVMTGFLTGAALSITFGQVADLTGAETTGSSNLSRAISVLVHPSRIDVPTLVVSLVSTVLLLAAARTRLANYGALLVLVGASLLVAGVGWFSTVAIVSDVSSIPRGFPPIVLPDLDQMGFDIVAGGFSVAAIVLVQGAGVAQSFPNPDGPRANVNGDFVAQGWSNVGCSLFRGIPVGGSVGSTAMSVAIGARSRWVAIMSGVWMLAVLVALAGLAEQAVMATLAAILAVASVQSISLPLIQTVWRSGLSSQVALGTTLLATLFLPVAAAVGIGVALSILLHLGQQTADVRLVELVDTGDGVTERTAPAVLTSDRTTVLNVYGSMFYAGARQVESLLPSTEGVHNARVVLRLRGRARLGATAIIVLGNYAAKLDAAGGYLARSGVEPALVDQLRMSRRITDDDPIRVVEATEILGESTRAAMAGEHQVMLNADHGEDEVDSEPFARRMVRRLRGQGPTPEQPTG
ncbi:MAG: SulP family inorganic anion transporter [Acidimicrobiales bacterium]